MGQWTLLQYGQRGSFGLRPLWTAFRCCFRVSLYSEEQVKQCIAPEVILQRNLPAQDYSYRQTSARKGNSRMYSACVDAYVLHNFLELKKPSDMFRK
jgi:hypothetical protein